MHVFSSISNSYVRVYVPIYFDINNNIVIIIERKSVYRYCHSMLLARFRRARPKSKSGGTKVKNNNSNNNKRNNIAI